jgi:hypothetical protein
VKWLADENFRSAIIRGVLRRVPTLDYLSTMIPAMREQMRLASRCALIVLVPDSLPASAVIEDLLLLDECAVEADWTAGIIYLPLR